MCLIVVASRVFPDAPLVLAANRDERRARPATPLHRWPVGLVAGRDDSAGGAWLAVRPDGAFAAVTNWREPGAAPGARSRGELPLRVLAAADLARALAEALADGAAYGGFHLIAGDATGVWATSNREPGVVALGPGVHAISNGPRGGAWPKMTRAARGVAALRGPDVDALLAVLADREVPPDAALPDTGVGLDLERGLGPVCIDLPGYGTRVSTVVVVGGGRARVIERTLDPGGGTRELAWSLASPDPRPPEA